MCSPCHSSSPGAGTLEELSALHDRRAILRSHKNIIVASSRSLARCFRVSPHVQKDVENIDEFRVGARQGAGLQLSACKWSSFGYRGSMSAIINLLGDDVPTGRRPCLRAGDTYVRKLSRWSIRGRLSVSTLSHVNTAKETLLLARCRGERDGPAASIFHLTSDTCVNFALDSS